jgi:hypothetical protein
MKAEHRKELQTNLLADRMGQLLQGVKGRPSRRGVLLVLLVLVLVVGGVIAWFVYQGGINDNSKRWDEYYRLVDLKGLEESAKDYKDTNQGRAARAEIAWLHLWEFGIKRMGKETPTAIQTIKRARELYEELAGDCKDDPVLAAEALYGIAVAEEALACDPEDVRKVQLDRALKAYRRVDDEHAKSGFAIKARERIKQLENEEERARIAQFYERIQVDVAELQDLHRRLGLDPSKLKPRK